MVCYRCSNLGYISPEFKGTPLPLADQERIQNEALQRRQERMSQWSQQQQPTGAHGTIRSQPNVNQPDTFSQESRAPARPVPSSSSSAVIQQTSPTTYVSVEDEMLWDSIEDNLVTSVVMSGEALLDEYVALNFLEHVYAAGRKRARQSPSEPEPLKASKALRNDDTTTAGSEAEVPGRTSSRRAKRHIRALRGSLYV